MAVPINITLYAERVHGAHSSDVICFTSEICCCIYHLEWHEKIHRNAEQISGGLFGCTSTAANKQKRCPRKRKKEKKGTQLGEDGRLN